MRTIHLREVNWIGEGELSGLPACGLEISARVRSTRPPVPGRLFHDDAGTRVELAEGEYGVSPGQACVFYSDAGTRARVLGGGFIRNVES